MGWAAWTLVLACFSGLAAIVIAFVPILIQSGFTLEIGSLLEESGPTQLTASILALAVTPAVFLLGWRNFTGRMSPGWRGSLFGLAFGLWALSCAIVLPYMGAYPVVWAAIPAVLLDWRGLPFWLSLYLGNLTVLPLVGMLLFRWMDRRRQRLDRP